MLGRPQKEGLSYFPCDVDILDDPKVQHITARFGAKGDGIFFRILCNVYRQGYALQFDEDAARLVARSVGDISLYGLVMDVVHESLKRGLFDEGIFKQFGLLTSRGIQKRYIKICKDSKRVGYDIRADLNLTTEKHPFPLEETPKIPEETSQRKEKKSKENNNEGGIDLRNEFFGDMLSAVSAWITYKSERNEKYKPTGLSQLISKIKKTVSVYGEKAVIDLIQTCMANNWQGIIWDKLEKQPPKQQGGLPTL